VDNVDDSGSGISLGKIHIQISQLFNYANPTWIELEERYCFRGLEEEMEVYDLVDLDVPGEPDLLMDIDSFEESVLIF
jgi:hypothetical protein